MGQNDPFAARTIGPYRLIASLGRGGQADVYLASRRGPAGFSKLIVIKCIRHELESDPRFRDALVAEAKLAARLQHPNVVQTLEVGEAEDGGQLYLAMEFLDGQPLSKLAEATARAGGKVDLPVAAAILSELLAGLGAAHDLRDYDGRPLEVIHRDLSPQNVFVTYQGEVKLIDFGIAKAATGGEVTEAGVVKGKVSYMAPEQARGGEIDRRVDLYAAGVVAWELLSGRRLADAGRPETVPARAQSGAPSHRLPLEGVPPALAAVVDRALAHDRDQRFSTATEMREALEQALVQAGVRKASREEVGRTLASLFEKERAWLQEKIRLSLAAAEHELPSSRQEGTLPTLRADLPSNPPPRAAPPRRKTLGIALGAVVLLAAGGLLGWRLWPRPQALRLCGSNTVGEALAPALVEAFQKRKVGLAAAIETVHTASGFKLLAGGQCDVGMASRTMTEEEAKGLGELRAAATEHVLALDAIAVIVHPDNPVRILDTEQVKAIFTGAVHDWSEVGGTPGPIEIDSLQAASTTYDLFTQLALGGRVLATGARRFDDSAALSDRVAAERAAIGFVGLAWVRSASAVAISDHGLSPTLPSPFTVASETYPFSRRLYLYTLPKPRAPVVADFVAFALSPEGQQIVRQSGHVDLSIAQLGGGNEAPPPEVAAVTAGARRLTLDFRFRAGGRALDSRGARDLDRLVGYLRSAPPAPLMLLGFGGSKTESVEAAKLVEGELRRRGIKAAVVEGFGNAMPLSSRDDATGQQRNRRVETWLK